MNVTYTPVSIGAIIIKSGNTPPVILGRKSAKQDYLVRDFARRARVLGVPVLNRLPKGFPGGFDTRPVCLVVGKFIITMTNEFEV